ncbi:hypothetical protein D9611_004092 [Ephemerocybe angulata]|uniref:F-box domain-containing protein n=1 Tax=Ephemerocybe angulata TaxID=980116 RepID=A0A8H5BKA9_9AGAR|nr:hypothetical protein D9611_004092 [Tulosesus angulatus]
MSTSYRRAAREQLPHETTVTIPDLPPELVLLLCTFLPDDDLYRLAFACKRLHHLALPVYLGRYGCDDEFIFDSLLSPDVMQALRSALYTPRLKRLVYTCRVGKGHQQGEDLRELLEIVEIEDFRLQPGAASVNQKGSAEDQLRQEPDEPEEEGITTEAAKQWTGVLDGLIAKARCRCLTAEMDSNQRSVESIEEGIVRECYRPHNIVRNTIARWFTPRTRHLEEFRVHSTSLFHTGLLQWTLGTLRAPSLTSVSFSQLHHFTAETWAILLPCITIPNLQQLSINLCAIATTDLYAFLARHPAITELNFGRNLLPPDMKATMPSALLPALNTLSGPPDYIVAFLSTRAFETLTTVRVLYRAKRASQFTLDAVNHDLAPVCLRLKSVPSVVLAVSFEAGDVDWVLGARAPDANQNGLSGAQGSSSSSTMQHSVSFVASCVTKVEFEANVYVLPLSIVFSLPKWLGGFARIKVFMLRTLASDARRGVSGDFAEQRKIMNIDTAPWQVDQFTAAFLHAVVKHCPGLRRVEVDGKEVEVPGPRADIVRLR